MPVTYTNRKGTTYTLCQGVTKTDKPQRVLDDRAQFTPVLQFILEDKETRV